MRNANLEFGIRTCDDDDDDDDEPGSLVRLDENFEKEKEF